MSPQLSVVVAAVGLPFLAAGATPLAARRLGDDTGYAGAAVALTCFALVATQLGRAGTASAAWIPSLDAAVRVTVDGWSLLFALLASGVGVVVFAYSARYMHGEDGLARYYGTLLAFMGSILGVAFAADLVLLFVFWELTSVCSFVLIGHETEDAAAGYSARMAMLVTVGGGLALLVGVLLLSTASRGAFGTATFDLAAMLADGGAMRAALRESGLFVPALALFAVAAGAKSAQVPLHFWLPNAMVAPTPVSAFLHSATMVKVGVYFVGRIRPLFLSPEWTLLFVTVGLATMTVGAVLAVASTDIKQLLAYSTASHLGLMVAGFGFGSALGAEAGVFHLLNHALFKAALFLVAGVVAHQAGTRYIHDLGGLWRGMPFTAGIAAVTGLSMAGVPPFNGFYSKEFLFEAAYGAAAAGGGLAWLLPATAVLASVFTVLYSLRFLSVFFGGRPADLGRIERPHVTLVVFPGVLAVLAGVIGIAPGLAVEAIVGRAVDATVLAPVEVHAGLPDHVTPPVVMSAVAILAGVGAYPFVGRIEDAVETATRTATPVRPNWWYDRLLDGTEATGERLGPVVHNGLLRTYATWVVAVAAGFALLGYLATGAVPLPGTGAGPWVAVDWPGVPPAMALVLAVAAAAGVAVTAASSHVAGVLTLSILGFMIAIFYILASAPDLALTQLLVETLVLLVFLLVLEELPEFYADLEVGRTVRDAALSVAVGGVAFLTVLLAAPQPAAEQTRIARYYVEQAVPAAGGTNVVNVILVDFRGFDTLGELLAVSVAAISVLVLITMRNRGETG